MEEPECPVTRPFLNPQDGDDDSVMRSAQQFTLALDSLKQVFLYSQKINVPRDQKMRQGVIRSLSSEYLVGLGSFMYFSLLLKTEHRQN